MSEEQEVRRRRRRRTPAEIQQIVREFKSGDLTQVEFCRRQDVALSTLGLADNPTIIPAHRLKPLPSPGPVHALTRICSVEYIKRMESVFEVISEPNRRAILSLLVSSEQSVGEIERQLRIPQPNVSKHLRVLREAGFVESTVDAQRRRYRLKPEPLQEIDAWLAQFRRFWSAHVDALERHLDRTDRRQQGSPTPTKTKTKEKKTRVNARE